MLGTFRVFYFAWLRGCLRVIEGWVVEYNFAEKQNGRKTAPDAIDFFRLEVQISHRLYDFIETVNVVFFGEVTACLKVLEIQWRLPIIVWLQ